MSSPALNTLHKAVVGLAAAWVVLLLVVFALRIGFALELEWMEGGMLHQALRLQRGEPIYPEPSTAFVPFLYTPGYAVTLAALGKVFPLDFVLGRAVSIAAWIAIGLGLWRVGAVEGKPVAHRAAAVGLWCSAYVFTFRWMDVARPDMLYLALTLWGLVLLREAASDELPLMLFVASPGCVQIRTGKVPAPQRMRAWLNLFGKDFTLHLDDANIARVWQVHKPNRDGGVTSLEAFDAQGGLVLQIYAERREGQGERREWRRLLDGLDAREAAA